MTQAKKPDPNGPSPSAHFGPVVLLAGGVVLAALGAQGIEVLSINTEEFTLRLIAMLSTVLIIALLLERAVEVLLIILCGAQELEVKVAEEKRVQADEDLLEREKRLLASLTTPDERMAYLTEGRSAERMSSLTMRDDDATNMDIARMINLKQRKTYLSMLFLCVFGGAIAIGGLRLLSSTIGFDQVPSSNTEQLLLLNSLDVLVTTLVLGGGAHGIHDIIERLRS